MGIVLDFKPPEMERAVSKKYRGTALVISDNMAHLETMELVTREMGFEPISKQGIREALPYIRCGGTRPKLIITNNNMEVACGGGIEVIVMAHEHYGPDMEVVLFSSEEPYNLAELREKYQYMYFAKQGYSDRGHENLKAAIRRTHAWRQ